MATPTVVACDAARENRGVARRFVRYSSGRIRRMKRRGWFAVVTLVALAIGAIWLWRDQARGPSDDDEAALTSGGMDRGAIVDHKLATRRSGKIDFSPCSATGRVFEADGAGIAGAVVFLRPKGLEGGVTRTAGQAKEPVTVRTDAAGGWEVPAVPPGRYTLSASALGYLPGFRSDVVLLAGRPNGGLDLELTPGGTEVSGVVKDVGGGPVADVMVSATRADAGRLIDFSRAPSVAFTDEDGRYRLSLQNGAFSLTTHHSDYVAAIKWTRIDDEPRVVDFELTPAGAIEGVVLSRTDAQPVPGAIVSYVAADRAQGAGAGTIDFAGEGRVVADDEGRFRLRGMSSGVFAVSAVAEGFASAEPVEVPLGVAEEVTGVQVLVDPAFKISGFVVPKGREQDDGLEGVLVGAFSLEPFALFMPTGPSQSDGYFEILGVRPGTYAVGAMAEQALPNLMGTSATVVDRDVTDVLVVMDQGVTITGRIEPATDAMVSIALNTDNVGFSNVLDTIGNAFTRTRADAEGNFSLSPVSPGKLELRAAADDGSVGEVELEVPPEGMGGVVIRLEPRAKIEGKVVDSNGDPVAAVSVSAQAKQTGPVNLRFSAGGNDGSSAQAVTNDDGSFNLVGLDAGSYDISVGGRLRPMAWADPDDLDDPTAPISFELEQAEQMTGVELRVEALDGTIRGVVLGPDGAPLPDAWVRAAIEDDRRGPFGPARRRRSPTQDRETIEPEDPGVADDASDTGTAAPKMRPWGAEKPVLTDAAGSFEITDLRAGTYIVWAEGLRGGARGYVEGVTPDDLITIEVEALARLVGRVREGSTPITRYTVTAAGPVKRRKSVYNADGRFELTRLDAGSYTVRVQAAQGVATTDVDIQSGRDSEIDVELEPFGSLSGTVVNATTGDPMPGLTVLVVPKEGEMSTGAVLSMFTGKGPTTGSDGRFEVEDVPPGRGSVMFTHSTFRGGPSATAEFEVEPGEDEDLGTIKALDPSGIEQKDQGDLGMMVVVRTYGERPRRRSGGDDDDGNLAPRLWVATVTKDGPAHDAGVLPGDELITVRGTAVSSVGPRAAAMMLSPGQVRKGADVSLELLRDGSRKRVTVQAAATSPDP